jgi:hypothetical protein
MTPAQRKIETAYSRAMNLRDAAPLPVSDAEEARYGRDYRKAYKSGDALGFNVATRRYLKALRAAND